MTFRTVSNVFIVSVKSQPTKNEEYLGFSFNVSLVFEQEFGHFVEPIRGCQVKRRKSSL